MKVWTSAEFDTTRSGVMYIRKRISPSQRQTPSYQVLETYREIMTGKVKQRVLINLGACPTCKPRSRKRGSSAGSKGRPALFRPKILRTASAR